MINECIDTLVYLYFNVFLSSIRILRLIQPFFRYATVLDVRLGDLRQWRVLIVLLGERDP